MSYFPINAGNSLSVTVGHANTAFDALARWFQSETAPSSPSSFQKWAKPSTGVVSFRDIANTMWCPWLHADKPTGFYFTDGTDSILLRGPADIGSGGYTLVLPAAQGANNQFLQNDGAGNLSWVTLGAGVDELNDLSDVVLTAPQAGRYIAHTGISWVDQAGVNIAHLFVASEANGDLIARVGGAWTRLPIGTNGQVLSVVSGALAWAAGGGGAVSLDDLSDVEINAPAAGHTLRYDGAEFVNQLGVLVGDLQVASAAQGDVIYRGSSAFQRLAIGTTGQVLTVVGGVPAWQTPAAGGSIALDDLTDVTLASPSTGKYLRFGGGVWADSALQMTDLTIGGQTAGDLMVFTVAWTRFPKGSTGQFLRSTAGGLAWETVQLGATTLGGLSDVTISGPVAGEVARYTGTNWTNARVAPADLSPSGTVRGALVRRGASNWEALAPPGTVGHVLTWDGTDAAWAAPSSGALDGLSDVDVSGAPNGSYLQLVSGTWVDVAGLDITDLFVASEARGDVIVRTVSGWARLPLGTNGQVLTSDGTDAGWADAAGGGGGNSFTTIDCPQGTDPVADSTTDTLTLLDGAGISITGDSSADSVTIGIVASEIDHDALGNFVADEHFSRVGTVSIAGAWSFDRSSASEVITDFTNPGAGVHTVRVDGSLAFSSGGFTGKITPATLTGARAWTIPNADGEFTIAGNSFQGTGSIVRASSPTITSLSLAGSNVLVGAGTDLAFQASGGNFIFDCPATLGQTVTVTLKDPGVAAANIILSRSAIFDADATFASGASPTYDRNSFLHRIRANATYTGARNWDLPNQSGEITVLGNAVTGTGSIVLADSPTISGTAIINAIVSNACQTVSMVIKEFTGSDTLSIQCPATDTSYALKFPAASTLPPSGTYYLKVDSGGNITYEAS